ncbi:hypothetical protein [Pedobacter caeni]|jgi:hypothetical protein|uniref:Uncharacterized protein n=1 Tax=Pedobacter caeni TaxID=288992 RepID=A0A1M5B850_9SPHI|nr:hypothetical protein [Pedobacter caeni]SHF38703.1 hypothetical protein SAMN04488522_1021071 [Pedobacter caeni]
MNSFDIEVTVSNKKETLQVLPIEKESRYKLLNGEKEVGTVWPENGNKSGLWKSDVYMTHQQLIEIGQKIAQRNLYV